MDHEVVFGYQLLLWVELFEQTMMINNEMLQTNGHPFCNDW